MLISPGLIVLTLLAMTFTGIVLWFAQSTYGTADHPTVAATIRAVNGGSALFVLMITAFYSGELVWRERDRKLNEIVDSTGVPSWVMTIPKILAIFLILVIVNMASALTGIAFMAIGGARTLGIGAFLNWFILPFALDMLQIAILGVFFQVLSPNKYVGWGLLFVWFVAGIFAQNMGWSNPLYSYGGNPSVPLSDFNGQGSFWIGAAVFRAYWLLFGVILIVIAHLLWPRGTDLGLRVRSRRMLR